MKALTIGIVAAGLLVLVGCNKKASDRVDEDKGASVRTEERKLTVIPPEDVTVVRGGTAQIVIKLKRDNYPDPVKLKFGDLPDDVEIMGVGGVDVDAGPVRVRVGQDTPAISGDSATFTIRAEDDADLVSNHVVSLSATGPGGQQVTTSFKITVKASE